MATATDGPRPMRRDYRVQLFSLAVPVLVLAASLWVGRQARIATAELEKREAEWQRTANELATVRQQFRLPSSTESAALIAESSRLGALGVPQSERVSLMEFLVNLAEASALTDVRVNFSAPPDTVFVPGRSIAGEKISPAPYAVTLDFTGGFAGVVKFVSNLPPSVTLSRLAAGRHGDGTTYHAILSVYELPNVNKGG